MNWGTKEYSALFKVMRMDGNPHPEDAKRPALKDQHRRYYDAFRSLSASRLWTQVGPSPLQVSEISAYLDVAGIDDPETKLKYLRLLQGLDAVELVSIRAKTSKVK